MFFLSEQEKLLIIIFASTLFLLSVLITVCVVSPICLFHKWFCKSNDDEKSDPQPKKQLITQESKHFQLSVVPHYGCYGNDNTFNTPNFQVAQVNESTKDKMKDSIGNMSGKNKPDQFESMVNKIPCKIRMIAYLEDGTQNNTIKLNVRIIELTDLCHREYGLEPSCYVQVEVMWHPYGGAHKSRRKSFKNKIAVTFQTQTLKRCLNPVFNQQFNSSEIPKKILKEGSFVIKVYDEERYANDVCLGQHIIPLKQLYEPKGSDSSQMERIYDLTCPNEFKGELLIEMCYLPTSNRITFSIVKGVLNQSSITFNSSIVYSVRILMFNNSKLIKKKKSITSTTMNWGDQEIITFDLMATKSEEISFMLVLSSRASHQEQNSNMVSSPSSPETPETPDNNNDSRKDKHLGHYVIGKEEIAELKKQPRKQIIKWMKLR